MANQPQAKTPKPPVLSAKEIAAQADTLSTSELLASLQARKLLREALEEEAFAEEQAKGKMQALANIEKEIQDAEAAREACSHMKEMGRGPAIVGFRDHSNNIQFLCLFCQKTWRNFGHDDRDPSRLPPHLHIGTDKIGGIGG